MIRPSRHRFFVTVFSLLTISEITAAQSSLDPEGRGSLYGARAAAFAGAYVSEVYDISSMYWNPAAISHVHRKALLWNYMQGWNGRSKSELLAFPVASGFTTTVTAGFNGAQFDLEDPAGAHRLGSAYGADIAAGFRIGPTFSAGILASYKYHTIMDRHAWTPSAAIGLLYAPSPEISYGMAFTGIGETIAYLFSDDSIGMHHVQLPKRLHLGLTLRFPSSRSERIISIILANDKIFGQPGIRYNGGMEWSVSDYFDLRAGYVVSPDYAGAKYGAGLRTGGIQLDYALSPNTATNRFHEFTIAVLL